MTVGKIIKAVRWCIDEEAVNASNIADVSAYDFDGGTHTDEGLMNNIIRHKISDALRWVCLYAPAELLSVSSSSSTDIIQEDGALAASGNILTPSKAIVRVLRVKGTGWHRAVLGESLLREDSEEYLQVRDSFGAAATKDRPQAVLINTKVKKVEVWPAEANDRFSLTYITDPSSASYNVDNDSTDIAVPYLVESSFIYYLAFLLLAAYGDGRAKNMYDVAVTNLGRREDKQRQ